MSKFPSRILKALGTLGLAILGGIFYRMGGSGNFARFWRELGQGLCVVAEFILLGLTSGTWQSILGTILAFGVCWLESTYWKKKGADAQWYNWAAVGAVFGLVPLPYCILTNAHWRGFGLRGITCIMLTILWQEYLSARVAKATGLGKDITDEVGRGFINIATIPMLLI